MPRHLSFSPDTQLHRVILDDAIEALMAGLPLEEVFCAPTYPAALVERAHVTLGSGQQAAFQRVVFGRAGEIESFTERCKTPETKLKKLLWELAYQKTLSA